MKKVTEVYHHGYLADGQISQRNPYLCPAPLPAPEGMRWAGFKIGHTIYGWTEPVNCIGEIY